MILTLAEEELIKLIRRMKIEFGEIPIVIYFQNGKVFRIKYEKAIVSQMVRKEE